MKIIEGRVNPGQGIGEYMLGSDEANILDSINGKYEKIEREDGSSVITIENAKFWFDSKKHLIQLGVTNGFLGKFDDSIGIGDTLAAVQSKVGPYYEEGDDYLIKGVKGIAFELNDADDSEWDELVTPIEWIYVFRVGE